MVRIVSLTKRFGDKVALDNLNLEIKEGEFFSLLGPNGAGKTTTLKILSGLMRPSEGEVYILGYNLLTQSKEVKRYLGYIPDSPFLYENLTCREFLEFVGAIFSIPEERLGIEIEFYLELFGLKEAENLLLREFSHGMRQKVVYISNFIHNPRLLLIDEPLVGLDPQSIKLIKSLLKKKSQEGLTIVMSTHILNIAEELADRIGILDRGRLIVTDTLQNLRKNVAEQKLEEIFLRLTSS